MKEALWQWAKDNSGYVSVGAFFSWGILISLSAPAMVNWWALPILILAHLISAAGIYFGYLKNKEGRRSILGMILGMITMLYNLSLSGIYLFI